MEDRKATILFYICNSLNAIFCFLAIFPASQLHPLLPFLFPYLYFAIRLGLYKLWYRVGYHPLAKRRYASGPKGGMHLPVFTKTTEEYRRLRQQQSLKYQVLYNVYKVAYRSFYFICCVTILSLITNRLFTEDNRYLGSPLQAFLRKVSEGDDGLEKSLAFLLYMMIYLLFLGMYKLGKRFWQNHFYKRYPVTVLLVERDEPIWTLRKIEKSNIFF